MCFQESNFTFVYFTKHNEVISHIQNIFFVSLLDKKNWTFSSFAILLKIELTKHFLSYYILNIVIVYKVVHSLEWCLHKQSHNLL